MSKKCLYSAKNCRYCTEEDCLDREAPSCIEIVEQNGILTYTDKSPFEERVELYMQCDKRTLAEMLAVRDFGHGEAY